MVRESPAKSPSRRSSTSSPPRDHTAVSASSLRLADDVKDRESLRERDECDRLRQRCVQLQRESSAALDQAAESERRCLRAQKAADALRGELEESKERERLASLEIDKLRRRNMSLAAEIAQLHGHHDSLQRELSVSSIARSEVATHAAERDAKLAKASQLIDNYQRQVSVAHEQIAMLRGANGELEERMASLAADRDRAVRRLDEARAAAQRQLEQCVRFAEELATRISEAANGGGGASQGAASCSFDERLDVSATLLLPSSGDGPSLLSAAPLWTALGEVEAAAAKMIGRVRLALVSETTSKSHIAHVDDDLRAALKDNATLSARAADGEVQLARLTAELQACNRELANFKRETQQHMELVGEILGCVGEWAGIETQAAALATERDDLRAKAAEQTERLGKLRAQLDEQWRDHDDKLQRAIHQMKREIEARAVEVRSDVDASVASRMLSSKAVVPRSAFVEATRTAGLASERANALQMQVEDGRDGFTREMLDLAKEHDALKAKYADALNLVRELQQSERRARSDADVAAAKTQSVIASAEFERSKASLLLETSSLGNAAPPSVASTAAAAAAAGFSNRNDSASSTQLLVLALAALRCAWADNRDLIGQRNVLGRQLANVERILSSPAVQAVIPVTSYGVRGCMRFRRAAIGVLAALRLRRLGAPHMTTVMGVALRGAPRIRLDAGGKAALASITDADDTATLHIALPHRADVLRNFPIAIKSLADVAAALHAQPPTDLRHTRGAPSLCDLLGDGLARVQLRFGRRELPGSLSSRLAGLVELIHKRSVTPGDTQPLSNPIAANSVLRIPEPLTRPLPSSPTERRSGAAPPQFVAVSPPTPPAHAQPLGANRSVMMIHSATPPLPPAPQPTPTPIRVAPTIHSTSATPRAYATQPPTPRGGGTPAGVSSIAAAGTPIGGSDEFTAEVLNVIRALDNRISGALRRSMHTMHASRSGGGSGSGSVSPAREERGGGDGSSARAKGSRSRSPQHQPRDRN